MKIILLPGMDGTGLLFKPLFDNLPKSFDIEIVNLNELIGDCFVEQAVSLNQQFTHTPIFIVAESYSGLIAYEYCRLFKEQVIGVIFVASFISSPTFFSQYATLLPVFLMKSNIISNLSLNGIGFDGNGSRQQISSVFESISNAGSTKIKKRLANIAELKQATELVKIPAVYIRPTNDLLVSNKAVSHVKNTFSLLKIVEVEGGHFIAQMQPRRCADIVLLLIKHSSNQD